jgi:hypothetical protein
MTASFAAVRSDDKRSTTEMAGFFGPGRDRLFGSFTIPFGQPTACILINSPVYAEQSRNYRREVILSRDLATRGIASLRYHYRGTGHSDGDAEDLTFASLCADAADALGEVQERFQGLPLGFVGTRLGGFVAASVASRAPSAPLLLWDPISSASRCLLDAIKAHRAGGMIADRHGESSPGHEADIWTNGLLDAVGHRVPRALFESFEESQLADIFEGEGRNVLIVTVVPKHEPISEAEMVADLLRQRTGSKVDVQRIDGHLSWWTARDSWTPDEDDPATCQVIAQSADWIQRSLTEGQHGS